jgi:low temperature requirement protein LtrA
MSTGRRQRVQALSEDASVTPLELFFDLVFVYALTQVTALMAVSLSGRSIVEGLIVLSLIWWCWVGFSWLGNNLQADEGLTRAAFLAVMATMFVLSLAIPSAFGETDGPGHSGAMVFAVGYAVVRIIHIGLFALAAKEGGDRGLLNQLGRFGVVMIASIVLAVVGAAFGGDTQIWLWLAAVAVDYFGTHAIGATGWRLRSAAHFAERHGLIIIIALGESIVAVGVGVNGKLSTPIIIASVLGIALAGAMWWIYFDVTSLAAERTFAASSGEAQARMARDAYTFIHLPMVAGIVLGALGMKKVLGYVAEDGGHTWDDPLHGLAPVALHVGVALYFLSLIALRLRIVRTIGRTRPVAVVTLLATMPIGFHIGAALDLALVASIAIALVGFEATRYAETRHRIRHLDGHAGHASPSD